MSEFVQPLARDGSPWMPMYLEEISAEECIGCGRCYKVCYHNVLKMMGVNDEGELVEIDDDDDAERMIMVIANKGKCIGCKACGAVCAKNAQKYISAEDLAKAA